jgi:integrase
MKLTEFKIGRLAVEPGQRDRLVFDEEQRGLAVRVTKSGGRTYLAQYTLHGTKHRVPLGSCSGVSLAKARQAAAAVMGDVAKGKHPAAERKEAARAERAKKARDKLTLETLIATWERLHLSHRRPRYAAEATRALRHAFARYVERPAEDLDRAAVVRALDGLRRKRKGKNADGEGWVAGAGIARSTAAYGRALYSWAIKRGSLTDNPFGNLPNVEGVASRDRVLTDDELTAIWRAAEKAAFPYSAIVRLLILTGQRREEVAGMTWVEIRDDLSTWTIPGARTKNGTPHIVPLSAPAREIVRKLLPEDHKEAQRELAARQNASALILSGERGAYRGWSKSKARLDEASGVADWRLHDVRRTLATGLQRLGVRLEVTEAVLNHVSGSRAGIVGVYQRHDWAAEKRAALEAWAQQVTSLNTGSTRANVVRVSFG